MSNMDPTDLAKVIADAVRGQVSAQMGLLAAELNETIELMSGRMDQLDGRVRDVGDQIAKMQAWVGGVRDGLDARVSGLEREESDTPEYRDWVRDEAVRLGIVKAKKKIGGGGDGE